MSELLGHLLILGAYSIYWIATYDRDPLDLELRYGGK